ncbi:MAG: isochorismatase family protein [Planctomycetaceae bacterium]|jgi:nicotinamidase-related amidase|nr:isochorismatase family protein [Planctomycetaceae bacterium]
MYRNLLAAVLTFLLTVLANAQTLRISTQERVPAEWDKNAYSLVNHIETWQPPETAIIVCDMWDKHWCPIANKRFLELAAALNPVLCNARDKGVLIVHSPSNCMDYYKDFAQRKILSTYRDKNIAALISNQKLPAESKIPFPIDTSDEGCECTPKSRNYRAWTKQTDLIPIKEKDLISESGEELGVYFKQHGIKNVILTGVATNMCVLHRPFGLRNMKRLGMNVVLMRDMTDTMYNPEKPPHVDHFSGTDLVVEYIEKYVCPTIVSTDFTRQKQFRFTGDKRKRIAFLIAEGEYHANQCLPDFAHELTLRNFSCDFALGVPQMEGAGRHNLENLQILEDADLAVFFVRRRALEAEKTAMIKKYVASGRPLLAIRTSCVAFDANKEKIIDEKSQQVLVQWKEFDRDILGGNYQNHYEHLKTGTDISIVSGMENHPILKDVKPFNSLNWLYKNRPLRSEKAQVLLLGSNPNKPVEPVLWTNGDRIVYTSLGHWDDWKIESFKNLMFNTVNFLLKEKNQKTTSP